MYCPGSIPIQGKVHIYGDCWHIGLNIGRYRYTVRLGWLGEEQGRAQYFFGWGGAPWLFRHWAWTIRNPPSLLLSSTLTPNFDRSTLELKKIIIWFFWKLAISNKIKKVLIYFVLYEKWILLLNYEISRVGYLLTVFWKLWLRHLHNFFFCSFAIRKPCFWFLNGKAAHFRP